ncbi:MAG: MFS transporter [Acidobacteriota bacterium]
MYQSRLPDDIAANAAPDRSLLRRGLSRNVWMLGLTSLLTDASSEMVTAVLPVYALYFLHLSPLSYGVIDGLQQGGASVVKLIAGWVTDRSGRHKAIAASGYAASALSRLGLLFAAANAMLLTPIVMLDRIGKGIRTAPRDAIISLSVSRDTLASAFGVHRALDTCGALIGPILGFAILRWIHNGYDVVFVVSLALAAIAVAAIITFVDSPVHPPAPNATTSAVVARAPDGAQETLSPRFIRIAASAAILGAASVSDSFIYLSLQRKLGFDATLIPLLFIATPAVYLTLAAPAGRLADRIGRAWVIVSGYAMLLGVYVALSSSLSGRTSAVVVVGLLGGFYAATDGVFAAFASGELPAARRATGLAIVSAGNDAGRMAASLAFGWFWTRGATATAVGQFQILLPVAMVVSVVLLWPLLTERHTTPNDSPHV